MNEPILDAISQRLIHLEEETRRRKIMNRVLLALLGLIVLLGATRSQEPTTFDEIRARQFWLMDLDGNRVGLLSGDQQQVGFSMLDGAGQPRLIMVVPKRGEPFIKLLSARGKSGLSFAPQAIFVEDEEARPRLAFSTKGPGGHPLIQLSDSAERARMTLALTTTGEPGILFKDTLGKIIWGAPRGP
jgi:hypothetical protein